MLRADRRTPANKNQLGLPRHEIELPVASRKSVESVNDLHISCGCGPGQGARDGGTERKGPLSIVAISRAGARRSPDIVSKARPDADETLRIVLARLDDMKAEDTTTIDLRNDSAIADYMVVTSGRSNRHVGSVADRVLEDLREAGLTGPRSLRERQPTNHNTPRCQLTTRITGVKERIGQPPASAWNQPPRTIRQAWSRPRLPMPRWYACQRPGPSSGRAPGPRPD